MDELTLTRPVPAWAKWLAQDANGRWCVYSDIPYRLAGDPARDYQWWKNSSVQFEYIYESDPNPDWRNTLVQI